MGLFASISSAVAVCAYWAISAGLGMAILGSLPKNAETRQNGFLLGVGFALGQAALLPVWLVMAMQGQVRPYPVATVLILAGVAGAWGWSYYARVRKHRAGTGPCAATKDTRLLSYAIAGLAAIFLLRSFGPFLQGDAVAYYMLMARETALTGGHGISWLNYAPFMSYGMEGHFAVMYLIAGEAAATLFDGVLAVNALLLVYVLGSKLGLPQRARWLAVATVISTAGFSDAMGTGKVDIASAQLGLAAIVLAFGALSAETGRFRYVGLAGLVAGACLIAKVSNALLIPVVTLAFFFTWKDRPEERKTILALWVVFGVATTAAMLPHFYHMGSELGEPLAPFLNFFTHAPMPPWASPAPKILGMIHEQRTLSNLDIALLPLTWTFVDRPWMAGNISPLYLAFLPLGFLVKWPRRIKRVGIMAAVSIAAWLIVSPFTLQTRYHFIGLMLLAVVTGFVIDRLLTIKRLKKPIVVALLLAFALTAVNARRVRYAIPYIAGTLERGEYFMKYSWLKDNWELADAITEKRRPNERAYLTRSTWYYPYFLDDGTLTQAQTVEEALSTWRLSWNTGAWQYVYDRGFRLILASKGKAPQGELTVDKIKNAPNSLQLAPMYEDETTIVYRLTSSKAVAH